MKVQTATLEVAQEIAEEIKANAAARQLPLNDYLRALMASENGAAEALANAESEPNQGMLEVMSRIAARNKGKPLTSGADTLKILREARAGRMFGYEPAE